MEPFHPALPPHKPHSSSPADQTKVELKMSTNGNGEYEKQEGDSSTRRDNKGGAGSNAGLLNRGSVNEGREGVRSPSKDGKMNAKGMDTGLMGTRKNGDPSKNENTKQGFGDNKGAAPAEGNKMDNPISYAHTQHASSATGIKTPSSGSALVDPGLVVKGDVSLGNERTTGGQSEDTGVGHELFEDVQPPNQHDDALLSSSIPSPPTRSTSNPARHIAGKNNNNAVAAAVKGVITAEGRQGLLRGGEPSALWSSKGKEREVVELESSEDANRLSKGKEKGVVRLEKYEDTKSAGVKEREAVGSHKYEGAKGVGSNDDDGQDKKATASKRVHFVEHSSSSSTTTIPSNTVITDKTDFAIWPDPKKANGDLHAGRAGGDTRVPKGDVDRELQKLAVKESEEMLTSGDRGGGNVAGEGEDRGSGRGPETDDELYEMEERTSKRDEEKKNEEGRKNEEGKKKEEVEERGDEQSEMEMPVPASAMTLTRHSTRIDSMPKPVYRQVKAHPRQKEVMADKPTRKLVIALVPSQLKSRPKDDRKEVYNSIVYWIGEKEKVVVENFPVKYNLSHTTAAYHLCQDEAMEIAYTHTRSRYSDHELRGYLLGDLARALQLDQDHHSYGRLRAYALNVARIAPTVFIAAFIAVFQLPGSCRLTPAERKELDEDYEKGLMRLLASEDQHVQTTKRDWVEAGELEEALFGTQGITTEQAIKGGLDVESPDDRQVLDPKPAWMTVLLEDVQAYNHLKDLLRTQPAKFEVEMESSEAKELDTKQHATTSEAGSFLEDEVDISVKMVGGKRKRESLTDFIRRVQIMLDEDLNNHEGESWEKREDRVAMHDDVLSAIHAKYGSSSGVPHPPTKKPHQSEQ